MTLLRKIPLTVQILFGMLLGLLVGAVFGERAKSLGELGSLLILLIKTFAVPMLFFAILDSVVKTEIKGRAFARLITVCLINSTLALAIGLLISNLFEPGKALQGLASTAHGADAQLNLGIKLGESFKAYIPKNMVDPFLQNQVLTLIALAITMGFALRRVKKDIKIGTAENLIEIGLKVFQQLLHWVIAWVPLAVFGVVAQTVGTRGFSAFQGLGIYVVFGLFGMFLHIVLVYHVWIVAVAKRSLRTFWKEAAQPVVYAMGANSSLATLPLTLQSLDRLKVSKEASTLGACVGTNFNNDGIILYEAMAVLMVAQAYGITLTLGQQVSAALVCLAAGIGIAGVPEAGLISLSLVLTTIGVPVEMLPLLLSVDWVVARMRSVTNVLGDMTVSIAVDR